MKTFEEIFRQEESLYRQYRKELKHDNVINKLALVVRSADQTIEHYQEVVARKDGQLNRYDRELNDSKTFNGLLVKLTCISMLANLFFIFVFMGE